MDSTISTQHVSPQEAELICLAKEIFKKMFGTIALVGGAAPGRVNLIGEHTDYNEGFVFPMAIPLMTVVVGCPRSDSLCHILTSSQTVDEAKEVSFDVDKCEIGTPVWANYIKGIIAKFPEKCGLNAVVVSSVPLGGGLSSSASLEVAFYTFLEALHKRPQPPKEKALTCQAAEHEYANVPCGIMDQFISVFGKEKAALLIDCRSMEFELVPLSDDSIAILITNSNVKHQLSGSEYQLRRQSCHSAANILEVQSLREASLPQLIDNQLKMPEFVFKRARHVITEIERCQVAAEVLKKNDYAQFGKLMVESHNSLRDDFEVSCPELDELVKLALEVEGVYGSRMTGGGFGGCTVTLVKKKVADKVAEHIKKHYSGTPSFTSCSASNGAHPVVLTS